MNGLLSLSQQFASELGLEERFVTAITVGDPVPVGASSDTAEGYQIVVRPITDVVVPDGATEVRNAAFVFVVEEVWPRANPSNINRTLVQLYVSPAAKLEHVCRMYRLLFGH